MKTKTEAPAPVAENNAGYQQCLRDLKTYIDEVCAADNNKPPTSKEIINHFIATKEKPTTKPLK
jgi:hypothetical protein